MKPVEIDRVGWPEKKFVSARYNNVRLEQRAVLQITVKVLIVPSTEALLFYRPNDKSI